MSNNTAVVKAEITGLAKVIETKKEMILHMLNKRLDLEYFTSTALLHVSENEYTFKVAKANPNSFIMAVVKGAEFGLSFSRGQAFLVPFGNDIVFMPGYIGEVQVMLRGQTRIHDIRARIVYEHELFEWIEGTNPVLTHRPLETSVDRGPIRGAYAIAFYRDGNLPHVEYMPLEELEKRRVAAKVRNKGKESPAFDKWPEEMYLRAPIRKLFKFIPQTEEGQKIMAYEDELWGYNEANVVEVEKPGDRTNQLADKLKAKTAPVEQAKVIDDLQEQPESPAEKPIESDYHTLVRESDEKTVIDARKELRINKLKVSDLTEDEAKKIVEYIEKQEGGK